MIHYLSFHHFICISSYHKERIILPRNLSSHDLAYFQRKEEQVIMIYAPLLKETNLPFKMQMDSQLELF